jgi:hypothetical protein
MAPGIHWEWRGFGTVSSDLVRRFCRLETPFSEPQKLRDNYLWVPGLRTNIKFRPLYPAEPFKIKRPLGEKNGLEKWAENEEDIFRFPLDKQSWDTLAEALLATINVSLGEFSSEKPDDETVMGRLIKEGVRIITVDKIRSSSIWKAPNRQVKVEWSNISSPQHILSIALENWYVTPDQESLPDDEAQEDLLAAIAALGLKDEPLEAMNYVQALEVWAVSLKL